MSKSTSPSSPSSPSSKPKSGAVKIDLDYPLEWGEEGLVKSIELKRPKGKHIKSLGRDANMSDMLKIAGKISGYTPAFFDEMDAADCLKVTEVIGDFLDVGTKTSKIS